MDQLLYVLKYVLAGSIIFDVSITFYFLQGHYNKPLVRKYFFVCLTMIGWEAFLWFGTYTNFTPFINNVIDRFVFFFGFIAVISIYIFLENYFGKRFIKPTTLRISLLFVIIIESVVLLFGPSISYRTYMGLNTYNYSIMPNNWLHATYIFLILGQGLIFMLMWKIIKSTSYKNNAQTKLIIISLFILLFFSITTNVILPLILSLFQYNYQTIYASSSYVATQILSAILSSIWTMATAYAVTRYQFLDIKFILQRKLIKSFGIVVITILSLATSFLFNAWLHGSTVTLFILCLIITLIAQFSFIHWRKIYLYKNSYDFSLPDQFTLLPHCQGYFADIEGRVQLALHKHFPGATYRLLVFDETEHVFRGAPASKFPTDIIFLDDDALVELAKTATTPVITLENLPTASTNPAITRSVRHFIKKHHLDFIVPLFGNKKVVTGFILISAVPNAKTYPQAELTKHWTPLSLSFGEYLRQLLTLELLSRPR